jgi:K+-transporting ATPase c subunit
MMASESGLDPDITLQNADFRPERVAAEGADDTKRDAVGIRKEIGEILPANASAAFGGLAGGRSSMCLEVILELCKRYGFSK